MAKVKYGRAGSGRAGISTKPKKKKRGVKPGTKPHWKARKLKPVIFKYEPQFSKLFEDTKLKVKIPNDEWRELQDRAIIDKNFQVKALTSATNLCGQLEEAIRNLEIRISNSIAKINSLM